MKRLLLLLIFGLSCTVQAGFVTIPIGQENDDAEEAEDGADGLDLGSSDLELIFDGERQKVGLRFNPAPIPGGVAITNAYIQFRVDEVSGGIVTLTFRGEAQDDSAAFRDVPFNISARPTTAASVDWDPPNWDNAFEIGPAQRTPDLSAIIQEIVDRPGWAAGQALSVFVRGNSDFPRVATAFDGSPPLLRVAWYDLAIDNVRAEVAGATAELHGLLNAGETLPANVTVYWGVTDGGQTPGSWDNSAPLGVAASGPVVYPIAGLSADTQYFYRFAVSDANHTRWARESSRFNTGSVSVEASDAMGFEAGNDLSCSTISRPGGSPTFPL
ncbi:MAG: hypothetical protein AAF492_07125 [Verrucomicrobiota bacterium]